MKATTTTTKHDGEYRVRLFIDGEYQAGADYFTDDTRDAMDTAAAMIKQAGVSDKTSGNAIREQIEYMLEKGATLYDVCNDYSLDKSANLLTENWSDYTMVKTAKGAKLYHTEHLELHYYVK